jgi:hypothetical protein
VIEFNSCALIESQRLHLTIEVEMEFLLSLRINLRLASRDGLGIRKRQGGCSVR